MSVERRADSLILEARLLVLRSRLLLPGTSEVGTTAPAETGRELTRLRDLQFVRTAAAWLDARPQLGRDVLTAPRRGRDPRVASYMQLMEACLAVLEHEKERAQLVAQVEVYRPVIPALFRVPEALARMRRQLAYLAKPMLLTGFLPELPEDVPDRALVTRSPVSSTFVAALELSRNAKLLLGDGEQFEAVAAAAFSSADRGDSIEDAASPVGLQSIRPGRSGNSQPCEVLGRIRQIAREQTPMPVMLSREHHALRNLLALAQHAPERCTWG